MELWHKDTEERLSNGYSLGLQLTLATYRLPPINECSNYEFLKLWINSFCPFP